MVKNVVFDCHSTGFSDHPSKLMAQILPENTQESQFFVFEQNLGYKQVMVPVKIEK